MSSHPLDKIFGDVPARICDRTHTSVTHYLLCNFMLWLVLNKLYNVFMWQVMTHWVKAGVVENRFEGDRVFQAFKEAEIPFKL